MVNESTDKTQCRQVGITEQAFQALNELVEKRKAKGIPANKGSIACELIIRENEKA